MQSCSACEAIKRDPTVGPSLEERSKGNGFLGYQSPYIEDFIEGILQLGWCREEEQGHSSGSS